MKNAVSRRRFIEASAVGAGGLLLADELWLAMSATAAGPEATRLPEGAAPLPVALPHFPDRLHAFVWRNWQLVPVERLAKVVGAKPDDILHRGKSMGLSNPPRITADQQRRSYITVLRRNWHLLPYEQLLELLGWTPEQMAFTLREDDFLYIKLGNLKPKCAPLQYAAPDAATIHRAQAIARIVREEFPDGVGLLREPLFGFVADLSRPPRPHVPTHRQSEFAPRFCYSYFALYGDPLLDMQTNPYPDGYLAQLAAAGVEGVWLQAVLHKLAPFPWDPTLSEHAEQRLKNLRALVASARSHGIGVYLYLNEPRAMPLAFFESRPELKGVVEGEYAAMCTSDPTVRKFVTDAVATICKAVPDLAGLFTITASENLTNCWSHGGGSHCPRCSKRPAADVVAELIGCFHAGIAEARTGTRLIAWDWGWQDDWVEGIINQLPQDVALMSVSEWSIPIERGGVKSSVGEYSISTIGPGPRATKHWALARKRGLKTVAKIQAGNTWELSAVPYIPAVANVAQHAANLRDAKVDGLMLGWTLGGYPSPNLEVVAEIGRDAAITPAQAMNNVAQRRFGAKLAPAVVNAWQKFSVAFSEFPFGDGLYMTPMQAGPSNPLWETPSGYHATMVGYPYDDLDAWRGQYPPEVFINQLEKIADGFDAALAELKDTTQHLPHPQSFIEELNVAEAAAIHFRSAANQSRFVLARRAKDMAAMGRMLKAELALARRLYAIQCRDSRIGFEASNQYYYVPLDLVEKAINCRDLLARQPSPATPR